ncbi:MAG: hypothetical protein CMP07_02245 [Xanthomonadales bacterium]|nr:hypothetical protein [Xanthomonadales bacterium]|tara:strand:+ start:488 stop:979 length:492 start_codon:yes stop_codon:yes gene_type:complete
MSVNRKLYITVTFACTQNADGSFGGGATYTQTGSTPDMGTIVDSIGAIHFDQAPAAPEGYNDNVDIEFTLASPCTVSPGNAQLDIAWATQYGSGMTVEKMDGTTTTEMSVVFDPSSPNVITIMDKDDDNNTYRYKPAVELVRPGLNNYYISLDPQITNRPTLG